MSCSRIVDIMGSRAMAAASVTAAIGIAAVFVDTSFGRPHPDPGRIWPFVVVVAYVSVLTVACIGMSIGLASNAVVEHGWRRWVDAVLSTSGATCACLFADRLHPSLSWFAAGIGIVGLVHAGASGSWRWVPVAAGCCVGGFGAHAFMA